MDIARELNAAGHRRVKGDAWTQPKVARVLHDRIWVGELVNAAGTFKIMEPLIDPELFESVQRGLQAKGGPRAGRRSLRFLLGNGLLRCGCCGHSMGVWQADTPAGRRERYRCTGRRSAAAECKQPDVPREPIDQAVLEYFTQVALDVEGTVAQLTGERDRRLAEVDAKLAQARSVQAEAEAQLERLDALLREGMTLDEWRRVAAPPQREAEAAAGAITDLTAEREAVEATGDVMDATGEFVERMTALRAAVAGEVNEADGILAAQTALRRVFDGFTLHRTDAPNAPRRVNAELCVGPPGAT
jgi:Recombinase zinc beta ribbon domain/Recombinase